MPYNKFIINNLHEYYRVDSLSIYKSTVRPGSVLQLRFVPRPSDRSTYCAV